MIQNMSNPRNASRESSRFASVLFSFSIIPSSTFSPAPKKLLSGKIQTGTLLGAPHINTPITESWRGPALTGNCLYLGYFLVGCWYGFNQHELSIICEGEKLIIDKNNITGPEVGWICPADS